MSGWTSTTSLCAGGFCKRISSSISPPPPVPTYGASLSYDDHINGNDYDMSGYSSSHAIGFLPSLIIILCIFGFKCCLGIIVIYWWTSNRRKTTEALVTPANAASMSTSEADSYLAVMQGEWRVILLSKGRLDRYHLRMLLFSTPPRVPDAVGHCCIGYETVLVSEDTVTLSGGHSNNRQLPPFQAKLVFTRTPTGSVYASASGPPGANSTPRAAAVPVSHPIARAHVMRATTAPIPRI